MKPKLAVTPGDPSGIGPEIIVKSLNSINSFCTPVLFGSAKLYQKAADMMEVPLSPDVEIRDISKPFEFKPGTLSAVNGSFAGEAIRQAVSACINHDTQAIITAPINKEAFKLAGIDFPGHTEFLGHLTGVPETIMLFYSQAFSVILHTIHVPLREAIKAVNTDYLIKKISFSADHFRELTGQTLSIAVCGLNPHAGENGRIGEEDFQIKEAVHELKSRGYSIEGPFPADTLFYKVISEKKFNLVYAMTHDQGLIPIKTLYPHTSVNITLGLPFIRVSVNHGTAFDIAWKGIADNRNFIEAVKTTCTLLEKRGKP